jgi:hypothetical protein
MKFQALFYFVLSLFGCDTGGSTFVDRVTVDGADALYSKAIVESGVARFECVRSASGACHYTVYPPACSARGQMGTPGHDCTKPIERFAVARGDSRQVTGLPRFRVCVSASGETLAPDCRKAETIAAW